MRKSHSLERRMLSYFGLIAAASILITLEFVWAIRGATPGLDSFPQMPPLVTQNLNKVSHALTGLQNKALLMCIVQAVVTLIVLIMFMRRITGPLQQMVEAAKIIGEGDLTRTISVRTRDEIGLLGETINGLTSNIQELVAVGLSTEAAVRSSLEELRAKVQSDPQALECVTDVETNLDAFRWIVDDFKLFPAPPASSDCERQG